ncbi:pseudouridine synthase [Verrucomicrobiota bacterium]
MEPQRLQKVMAQQGLCSRREADRYIEQGLVYVDGKRAELGMKVMPDQQIELSQKAQKQQSCRVTVLLNKPVGYVSGQPEDNYKPAVALITPGNQFKGDKSGIRFNRGHLKGIAPAGRLDIDSNGLLVLTQDGLTARKLIGSETKVEKEYLVRVKGNLTDKGLKLLNHGLSLDGKKLKPAEVSWQNEDQLRFILKEGRKRQIRRMCELVGLKVVGLKRVRIGNVKLGDLPPGKWRYLRPDERF